MRTKPSNPFLFAEWRNVDVCNHLLSGLYLFFNDLRHKHKYEINAMRLAERYASL